MALPKLLPPIIHSLGTIEVQCQTKDPSIIKRFALFGSTGDALATIRACNDYEELLEAAKAVKAAFLDIDSEPTPEKRDALRMLSFAVAKYGWTP